MSKVNADELLAQLRTIAADGEESPDLDQMPRLFRRLDHILTMGRSLPTAWDHTKEQ